MRDLAALPKGHLHLHLEGAMRPSTREELAARTAEPVPTTRGAGRSSALADLRRAVGAVLQSDDDLRRLVDEVVADAATAGAVWVEPTVYAPAHRDRLGPPEHVLEVILDQLARSGARHGIGTGLVVSADRTLDPADAVDQARLAVRHAAEGVVSFGLSDDEVGYPPELFADAHAIARDGGLLSTPHPGEREGPEGVRGALVALGADRIPHGVRAVEDPAVVELVVDAGVCLDVCSTSDLLLGVVPSLDAHPLPALLDAGIPCSLNADDPLLLGPGLLDEYERARTDLGLDDDALAGIARASITHSGAPDACKTAALARIDAWLT